MSLESVRQWLAANAPDLRLIEVTESTATVETAATAEAGSAPNATAAATAWAALPRLTAPGSAKRIGRARPSGP